MKNFIVVVGILSLLWDYSLTLQIGAFNTGVYGQTKSSRPEVVSMIMEVPSYRLLKLYIWYTGYMQPLLILIIYHLALMQIRTRRYDVNFVSITPIVANLHPNHLSKII